jgi:hypothetical protein
VLYFRQIERRQSVSDQLRIGMAVRASDGEAGIIDDILMDENGMPRFLVIRDRGVFGSDAVLPFTSASTDGGAARIDRTRQEIHAADRYAEDKYGKGAGLFSSAAARYDQRAD